jgi:peptidoglycan/xylan/chitin deacetylase (PgdA/CDA1 family)
MRAIYMYHAIGSGAELAHADPHYAVPLARFKEHLAQIGRSVALAEQLAAGRIEAPCVTFDDGHFTNYANAFPALLEAGLGAEFYINPAMVGQPGFVTWAQLGEMAAQRMSIQSHAQHHVMLSDLDDRALRRELAESKQTIEDRLGRPVVVLAPPGGRYDRRTIDLALSLGYQRLAVSRPGLWRRFAAPTVPRFPVYADTPPAAIAAWQRPTSRATLRALLRYRLTRLGQQALGNRRYEQLRNHLVARAG